MSRMEWSSQQKKALAKVKRWKKAGDKPFFTLAGFAGTGKTTLAREVSKDVAGKVYFAAYTGKAAFVLRKSGIPEASTIHSLIYMPINKCNEHLVALKAKLEGLCEQEPRPEKEIAKVEDYILKEQKNLRRPDFFLKTDSPLGEAGLLVIDEYSMVDQQTGEDLLSFNCPILALGDPGQLPPVNGFRFFRGEPDVTLTEIHRQASGNPIIDMSRTVREGKELSPGSYGDSRVFRLSDLSEAEYNRRMLAADQILVGTNANRRRINQDIRKLLGRKGVLPVVGDKLVCLRNNHREGLLNGQIWIVERVSAKSYLKLKLRGDDNETVACQAHIDHFEGKGDALDYKARRLANEFDFGYALTVHKSQGSQWENVVVRDDWSFRDREKWLYTAITRAAKTVTIIR